jgi:hypothetical protein
MWYAHILRLNIHYFSSWVRQRTAQIFMPRNSCHARGHKELVYTCLKHKGGHAEGDPPKNWCGAEGSEAGAPPPVFGGEGRRPVVHIDKGHATCNLFKKLKN